MLRTPIRLLVPALALAVAVTAAHADIINVPGDQPTIQAGIDAAVSGMDEVVVAPGTYNENINFNGKQIILRSSGGPDVTIIDGTGAGASESVVKCVSGEGHGTVLDGFTITGGRGTLVDLSEDGPPVFRRVGGGMLLLGANPTVSNCRFIANVAEEGGGMFIFGGSSDEGRPLAVRCTFDGNVAAVGGGGAIRILGATVTLLNCEFLNNSAVNGGAILQQCTAVGGELLAINCSFSLNSASSSGGAISTCATARNNFLNCSFSANIALSGVGGAITAADRTSVLNCILWGDSPDEIGTSPGATPTVQCSDIQGGWPGTDNIDAHPLFVSAVNLRLRPGSPAIDRCGTSFGHPTDLEGNDRILNGHLDMGAYESTGYLVFNLARGTAWGRIANAFADSENGDELLTSPLAFQAEPFIDFDGKALSLASDGEIIITERGLITMADGAALASAGTGFRFELRAAALLTGIGDSANLMADFLDLGTLTVEAAAVLDVDATATNLHGMTRVGPLATLAFSGTVDLRAPVDLFGGAFVAGGLTINSLGGTLVGYGNIVTDLINDNQATYLADTQAVGDYTNNGTTTVQNGTLTIIGTLTNNGTIIGDVAGGAASELPVAAGDGLAVLGDFIAGAGASLHMSSADLTVKVAGDFDVAIDDNLNYDMAQAELRMIGLGGQVQSLETMSADVGADLAGFDRAVPGSFPLGTLRIGPTPTIVSLVDTHDNDGLGQAMCEAVYARHLVVEAGAVLNTNGCPVYYNALVLNGVVDDPTNLIQVNLPDIDGDGVVGPADLSILIEAWGACPALPAPCPADINGDGSVNVPDLLTLLANWTA